MSSGFLRGKPRHHSKRTNMHEQWNSLDEFEERRGQRREGRRCINLSFFDPSNQ